MRKLCMILALLLAAVPAKAGRLDVGPSALCTRWFAEAERTYGLPSGLLMAVSLTESGVVLSDGRRGPWPWMININGKDVLALSKEEALAVVAKADPTASLDLGCMQINRKWHWQDFPGRDAALVVEPRNNVFWAAWWLRTLRNQYGSWTEAVGKYHSFRAGLAQGYRERVVRNAAAVR